MLKKGEISSAELTRRYISRIEKKAIEKLRARLKKEDFC